MITRALLLHVSVLDQPLVSYLHRCCSCIIFDERFDALHKLCTGCQLGRHAIDATLHTEQQLDAIDTKRTQT